MKRGQTFEPLANCHAKGLFSLPLEQGDSWVRRMFIDTLGLTHTVAPHSHRYPLILQMVHGRMNHTIWHATPMGALEMYHYKWHSPLLMDVEKMDGTTTQLEIEEGRFELIQDEPVRYDLESALIDSKSRSVEMDCYKIHSLKTTPGASWVITEYLDDTDHTVTLHHSPQYKPDLSGLYVPINV